MTQHLTSVDIEEIVRVGGVIVEISEGFSCDNLDFNLFEEFEEFVIDMTAKRNKFKKEKKNYKL